MRPDREDLTAQHERLMAARRVLADALTALAIEGTVAARRLHSTAKRLPEPDMPAVYGAVARVRDAENGLDMARADLATAGGTDLWEVD